MQPTLTKEFKDSFLPIPISPAVSRPSAGSAAHGAADDMNRSGKTATHEQMVLKCLNENHRGLTAPEVGASTGLGHIEAQRRLSGLNRKGVIEKSLFKRLCCIIGKEITVWSL